MFYKFLHSGKSDEDDGYVDENTEDDSNTELEESFAADDSSQQKENECDTKEPLVTILSHDIGGGGDFSDHAVATIPHIIQETDISTGTNDQISSRSIPCTSILRRRLSTDCSFSSDNLLHAQKHSVSFPSDISCLVSYREPSCDSPWIISK